MNVGEITLIIVNLFACIGCGVPLAKFLNKTYANIGKVFYYFRILIYLYLIECITLISGMGIPIFNVCLAFVWAAVFWLRLRSRATRSIVIKSTFYLSLYSSLPAASFIFIPIISLMGGWSILSAEEGYKFGIPDFLNLSWPFNTILGFYLLLVMFAVVFKTIITVGGVYFLIHRSEQNKA